jgi:hypothetical protein
MADEVKLSSTGGSLDEADVDYITTARFSLSAFGEWSLNEETGIFEEFDGGSWRARGHESGRTGKRLEWHECHQS